VRAVWSDRIRSSCTFGWEIEIMDKGRMKGADEEMRPDESSPGIVVTDCQGDSAAEGGHPRIAAFIWGGKVRPTPTLPYGRWKGAA
jgi:hypothetical protein